MVLLPAHPLVAQSVQTVIESQNLDKAFECVEKGVDGLKVLSEQVKTAPVSEQGALAFRLDQRGIHRQICNSLPTDCSGTKLRVSLPLKFAGWLQMPTVVNYGHWATLDVVSNEASGG